MQAHSQGADNPNKPKIDAQISARLARDVLRGGLPLLALTAAACYLLTRYLNLGDLFTIKVLVICLLGLTLLLLALPAHLPQRRFGAANQTTMLRAALVALLLGLVGEASSAPLAWSAVAIALLAAALDAVDGRLARRQKTASAFGARFDMETDALLILALSLLAWQLDKSGVWVLLGGVMRYLFVVAGQGLRWLRRPLPPSRRRQTVCVLQVVSLILCIMPVLASPWSDMIAAAGLLLLSWSFLVDILWLARHNPAR